jgi:RimJ/RimL family protein N-acetyltransferase
MPILITTKRLLLQTWQTHDRAALEMLTGDSEMMHYLTDGRVWSDDEIDEFYARQQGHQANHGICMGLMLERSSGDAAGVAGLQPLDDGTFELGWWVWKAYWGQGFASEAGRALIRHARETMQLNEVFAVIDPANQASIRVAEKIGMHYQCQKRACETVARRGERPVSIYHLNWSKA